MMVKYSAWGFPKYPDSPASGLLLRRAASLEHLPGDVEAHAEVVDEVEEREGLEDRVGVRHLDEDGDVTQQPERRQRQGDLAEGDRARRVDVPDGDEDQQRADEQQRADGAGAEVEDDYVERSYVPVAREAQEEMVGLGAVSRLGVHPAELVARREDGERSQSDTEGSAGQVAGGPQKEDGGEDVGHVVHDVVQEHAVEKRQELLYPKAASQEAVGAVYDEGREHEPQGGHGLAVIGGYQDQERQHRSARRVQVHRRGPQAQPGRDRHRALSVDVFHRPSLLLCPATHTLILR